MERYTQAILQQGIKPTERWALVRIAEQTLQFFRGDTLVKAYSISTSLKPPSNRKNSLGTPRGLHEIAERIGAGQPPGMVFKSRIPLGLHFNELPDADQASNLVTTRILWLRGLEPGTNQGGEVDSYERYIYVHGTNHEERIGQPQSGGCVLMRNLEMIELYEEMRRGDHVLITD